MPGDTAASAPPPPSHSFPLLEVTILCTETAEFKKKKEKENTPTPQPPPQGVPRLPQCKVQHTGRSWNRSQSELNYQTVHSPAAAGTAASSGYQSPAVTR